MPYNKISDLPEGVKGLPKHAQEIYMAAYNSAAKQYPKDEAKCHKIAWGAVKQSYEKKGDSWVKKAKELQDDTSDGEKSKIDVENLNKRTIEEWSNDTLAVCLVHGDEIRGEDGQGIEPDFTEGGNWMAYPWMKDYFDAGRYELWLDDSQDSNEQKLTILHEATEAPLMMDGEEYDPAHLNATEVEQHARENPDELDKMLDDALANLTKKLQDEQDDGNNAQVDASDAISARDIEEVTTLAQAYAWHNKIHADYVDARWGRRNKEMMQKDHEAIVRRIKKLGGRHIAKGETLDETLPNDLREPVKLRALAQVVGMTPLDEEVGNKVSNIQVLRTGTFYHPKYGKFSITMDTLSQMLDNFQNHRPKAPTEMCVDYEHMSVAEPAVLAPAAGWVKGLSLGVDALYANVEWTDDAAEMIGQKKYRYISPEFTLNYTDKETGSDIGPTLLSVALTNRPFLEGMEPVVLSRELQEALMFREACSDCPSINYFTNLALVEWTRAYINELPDSCFAYIDTGGTKDEGGKTTPRSLRHLPYKDKDGKVDLPHLRNALARLPQSNLSAEAKKKAQAKLEAAAKKAGVGDYSDVTENKIVEVIKMDDKLKAEAAKEAEAKALKEQADKDALQKERDDALKARDVAMQTLMAHEADSVIAKAIDEHRVLPKEKDWARALYLKDKVSFDAWLILQDIKGPNMKELGKDGGEVESVQLTESEMKIGEGMAKALGKKTDEYFKLLRESKAKVATQQASK